MNKSCLALLRALKLGGLLRILLHFKYLISYSSFHEYDSCFLPVPSALEVFKWLSLTNTT